jgi:outer membrane protein assembly factor BamB/ABC-type phosphate/phosphonate transport system substrate-binding protein
MTASEGRGEVVAASPPLRMVVIDPLAAPLACDCVAGYAQRKYEKLGDHLQVKLDRPVEIAYAEALSSPQARAHQGVDLIIGKCSVVAFDAKQTEMDIRSIAMLTGKDGKITQTGLFVVRNGDSARVIEDLRGSRLLFGPEDSDEKLAAAFASLEAFDIPVPDTVLTSSSCSTAALAVAEKDADAAVVSSYAMPLLKGCGTIDKGVLRVVGETDPVPFIGVFATNRVSAETEQALSRALRAVRSDPTLLTDLESKDGFVPLPAIHSGRARQVAEWTDWRGPGRHAISHRVPANLPAKKQLLWSRTMTGPGMSGLAVAAGYVVAADKSLDESQDVFRCLDADTGREMWKIAYPAAGDMDYTNSPRANPVVHQGLVYLLGAFGDLHCIQLATGDVVWRKHLAHDFNVKRPQWGYCSAPLLVGDMLIVNPGAEDASLAALDRLTGEVLWTTPGASPGYACFVHAELGGVRQVVGYDRVSLGGWDPESGKRLWKLVPELKGDFNVPTPIVLGGKLLVTTENNGTRLYGFEADGQIKSDPLARNDDLAPDTSTPIAHGGVVLANYGGLMCLDLDDELKTLWEVDDDALTEYCTFIAGNGHVLVMSQSGKLVLVRIDKQGYQCVASLDLFDDVHPTERDVWSHPALVGNRLYVRNLLGVYCFVLE